MKAQLTHALFGMILTLGCRSAEKAAAPSEGPAASPKSQAPVEPVLAAGVAQAAPPASAAAPASSAEIGKPAPDFELTDLDGKLVRLADFRGKIVVLEWFNPGCPFVRAAHTKGSLVRSAHEHASKDIVWLAINSGAAGKEGAGREATLAGKQRFGMEHPILLDESGRVGKLYGARTTPHMFVIDARGVLVYRGAIDNSPDGEGESPTDGALVNYVDQALLALNTNKPVAIPETKSYGCSVKYAN